MNPLKQKRSTGAMLLRTLEAYSAWLENNGVLKTPRQSGDPRTHDELVAAFVKGKGRVRA